MKKLLKKILRSMGFMISRYSIHTSHQALTNKCLEYLGIDLLIDIGANTGQYAKSVREAGYTDRIFSFEPLKEVFMALKKASASDAKWEVFNYGVGNRDEEMMINVSDNLASSSLLKVTKLSTDAAPESGFRGTETISIVTLDSFLPEKIRPFRHLYLKVDVQGYELEVLRGARNLLPSVKAVQLEMSFVRLYEQGPLFKDIVVFMEEQNFELYSILPDFRNEATGQMLQADGIFINKLFH